MNLRLVSNLDQVISNHAAYQDAMRSGHEIGPLIDVIPYIHSWIARRDPSTGEWLFAPSKFVGYVGMTRDIYGHRFAEMDGRLTEKALAGWMHVVHEGDTDYEAAHEALYEFCARFGKKPNSRCRISVLDGGEEATSRTGGHHAAVADLLVAVFNGLPRNQRQDVLRRLR